MRNHLFLLLLTLLLCFGCAQRPVGAGKVDIDRRVSIAVAAASKYLQLGDTDNAHRHLMRALELKPRHAPAHNVLALLYSSEGDVKKAEQSYKKSIRLDPNYAPALNNYGTFLYSQDRFLEAKKYLGRAASDFSYDKRVLAYENLGLVALRLGNESAAVGAFNNALRLGKPAPKALLELAAIYSRKGQYPKAKRHLEQYTAIEKHGPRSLYLGIGIAQATGDVNAHASYVLALKNLFPNSLEYRHFKETQPR